MYDAIKKKEKNLKYILLEISCKPNSKNYGADMSLRGISSDEHETSRVVGSRSQGVSKV